MLVYLAAQWGLFGALVSEALEYCNTRKQHNAHPWELVLDPETGKLCVDRPTKEILRSRMYGYFITVLIMGAVGAVVSVCAMSSGLPNTPFMPIGIGATSPTVLSAMKKIAVTNLLRQLRSVIASNGDA